MNKHIKQTNRYLWSRRGTQGLLCGAALLVAPLAIGQDEEAGEEEEVFELSPFTVEGSEDQGYRATSTMAGTRIRTDLKDVGSAISVITEEFLRDTGAVDNESLLLYTTNTETGGIGGNFAGDERLGLLSPNSNNRVRGLTAADNTRDYFLTDLPWDGYNVNRIDMQRGPNSILSGLGSPAGIINNSTTGAHFENSGEIQLRFGSYGAMRAHFNINRVILEDELGIRVAALNKDDKFRQEEAWSQDERLFVALKYEPKFLKTDNALTTLTANFETGKVNSNRPRTRPPVDQLSGWWKTYTDDNGVTWPSQIVAHPFAFAGRVRTLPGNQVTGFGDSIMPNNDPAQEGFNPNLPPNTSVIPHGPTLSNGLIGQQISFNNPYYGENYTDGPILYFANADKGSGEPTYFTVPGQSSFDYNTVQVDTNGNIVRDSGGTAIPFYRSINSVAGTGSIARDLGLYLAEFGGYGNELIYDRSIFDYKNHLIDGPNKREFQDFEVKNIKLGQTFWGNRVGIEIAVDEQSYLSGQESPFGWSPHITIDTNSHLADFSPNPNAGRPVIFARTQGGANSNERIRESYRVTAFAELRQGDLFESDSFLGRLVGKQRVTAVKSGDDVEFSERGWKNWLADNEFRAFSGVQDVTNNMSEVMVAAYLGPDLRGTSSPSGINLQPVPDLQQQNISTIRVWDSNFDTSRNPLTVDFLQSEWINPWTIPNVYTPERQAEHAAWEAADPATRGDEPWNGSWPPPNIVASQQDNPANQVGWVDYNGVRVMSSETGDIADLYTLARSKFEEIRSEAFVWQGYFWDGALVPTYGHRKDTQQAWDYTAPRSTNPNLPAELQDGRAVFLPDVPNPDYTDERGIAGEVYEGTTESWSVVLHADHFLPELPWGTKLSLFYNESSNFQPGQSRVNHLNQPLAPPSGETEDYGFVLSTLEDRLTLKFNFYESTVEGASHSVPNLWYLGTAETSLFVAAMRDNAFLTGVPGWSNSWQGYANSPYQEGDAPWDNYLEDNGIAPHPQTDAEALAWQQRAVAAGLAGIAPQEFWDAWGANQSTERWQSSWWDPWNEGTGAEPAGFTTTSDLISEGKEIEISFNPTENWNFAINASQTKAVRENLAGSLKEWVEARNLIHNGDAGDLRLWWNGDRNNTLKTRWNNDFYSGYQLELAKEGQAVDELREWRMNLVTNYNFRDGRFKGLSVGGSLRWEDEVGIGYPQSAVITEDGNRIVHFDIDNPYTAPTETHMDLWAGYEVALTDTVQWRIQLNVRDVLADGELIPLSVQPDGSIREYRLEGDPNWFLTNTFTF